MSIDCCKSYVGKQIIGLLPSEQDCLYYLVIDSLFVQGNNFAGCTINGQPVGSVANAFFTSVQPSTLTSETAVFWYTGTQPDTIVVVDPSNNEFPFTYTKVTDLDGSCDPACYQASFDYGYVVQYFEYFTNGGAYPATFGGISIDDEYSLNIALAQMLGPDITVSSVWNGSQYVVTINGAFALGSPLQFDDGAGHVVAFDLLPCEITPPTPVPLSLLTAYPGATAAYSVRKLSTTYTGAAIRVRRSSDNTESDIGFVGLDLDTTSLTSFVGSGSGFVVRWYDQSGNGNDFFINIATNQPTIINSGTLSVVNLKPAIKFDGSNDYYNMTNSISLTGVISIFTVARLTRNHTTYSRLLNGKNDQFVYIGTDASENIVSGYGNGASWSQITANSATNWLNTQRLVSSLNNGTDSQFVNNVAKTPRVSAFASFNNIFMLGGTYVTGTNNIFDQMWQGEVQELIIYPNYQISNNNGINTNIMTYYGI